MKNLKPSDFEFSEDLNRDIDRYLAEPVRESKAYSGKLKDTKYESFPSGKFRKIGARVSTYHEGFIVDFSRVIMANPLDEEFIKRILLGANNDLINVPEKALWTIRKVGSKKFYIARA